MNILSNYNSIVQMRHLKNRLQPPTRMHSQLHKRNAIDYSVRPNSLSDLLHT